MKRMFRHLPNTLTCMNLLFGCFATVLALKGNYSYALCSIFIAAAFDFFDGLCARILHAQSAIGKELDSLADVVSFGVAPGMMLYCFFRQSIGDNNSFFPELLLLVPFVIPVFSALRLAKFNIDTRQTESFLGLPVPAHAIFWASLVYGVTTLATEHPLCGDTPLSLLLVMSGGAIASSFLLVSEIPMFALKFKTWKWKGNEIRYVFLCIALLLIAFLGILGMAITIVVYVLLSVCTRGKK